jgi:cellulose biosynthesis protein BcsQ
MKAKIFTMASAKGGSGKTLLSASFSSFLSELGKKVLVIDSDSTTNGLTLMFLKEVLIEKEITLSNGRKPSGLFDFSENNANFNIVKLENGVSLIPATFNFDHEQKEAIELIRKSFYEKINRIIMGVQDKYDYIFIDAQAGSDFFAEIAINKNISHEVIIVSEYDPLSAAGVERLKGIFRQDLTYNRTWYLLNKMIPEFIQSFSDFLEIAKYLNPIPWDSDVVKAYARRKLPLDFDNGNEFTLALIQTLKTLLGEDIAREIDEWKKQKTSVFVQPINKQYEYLKSRMIELESIEKRNRLQKSVLLTLLTSALTVVGYYFYKYSSLQENIFTLIAVFTAIATIFTYLVQKLWSDKITYNGTLEKDVIYEKLKKLEILRYSDFDSIVRDKSYNQRKFHGGSREKIA